MARVSRSSVASLPSGQQKLEGAARCGRSEAQSACPCGAREWRALRAAADAVDEVVERDPVAQKHVRVAINVNRVRKLGVERLDCLLGHTGTTKDCQAL